MNFQNKAPQIVLDIFKHHKIDVDEIDFYAWPQNFSDTSGPHGGMAGQAMSVFTLEAWVANNTGPTVYQCAGFYKFEDKRFQPLKRIFTFSHFHTFKPSN